MTKAEDQARQKAIDADFLARVVHDSIEGQHAARRLYPDLYALEVAENIRLALVRRMEPINRDCPTCKSQPGDKCVMVTNGRVMEDGFHAMRYPQFNSADIQKVLG